MSLENLKKHMGQLANTGVRVAVVFRKIPNDENNCLIVETERLPDSYHDYVIQCLNSKEASETNDFFEVLNRRTFPDGLNCLTSLHQNRFLRKEPVANVTMVPLLGKQVPLALINAAIDNKMDEYNKAQQQVPETTTVSDSELAAMQDPVAVAKGLILQAELLEKDAKDKREEAYALAPDLKPGRGRPATPEELKAEKLEERKEKRRIRERAKTATNREEKPAKELEAKVNAKIARDQARTEQVEV